MAQELAQPLDRLWVESIGGLVEHQAHRISEYSPSESETLRHAKREGLGTFARDGIEAHHLQHLIDASIGDAGVGPDHPQMVAGGALRVKYLGIEVRTYDARSVTMLLERLAIKRGASFASVEVEHQSHRGGFACAIWPQESRYHPSRDSESQRINGQNRAVSFREPNRFDSHIATLTQVDALTRIRHN
jgi:hypothetical protein